MTEQLKKAAMALCVPPFQFERGYIWDSAGNMIADNGEIDALRNAVIARVRGWGRIGYTEGEHKPEDLQDEIGRQIVEAMNAHWNSRPSPWVPVSARTPDEITGVDVLINSTRRVADCLFIDGGFYVEGASHGKFIQITNNVTHWMPLPPAPETKGE